MGVLAQKASFLATCREFPSVCSPVGQWCARTWRERTLFVYLRAENRFINQTRAAHARPLASLMMGLRAQLQCVRMGTSCPCWTGQWEAPPQGAPLTYQTSYRTPTGNPARCRDPVPGMQANAEVKDSVSDVVYTFPGACACDIALVCYQDIYREAGSGGRREDIEERRQATAV